MQLRLRGYSRWVALLVLCLGTAAIVVFNAGAIPPPPSLRLPIVTLLEIAADAAMKQQGTNQDVGRGVQATEGCAGNKSSGRAVEDVALDPAGKAAAVISNSAAQQDTEWFQWSGGGVMGLSEGAANRQLHVRHVALAQQLEARFEGVPLPVALRRRGGATQPHQDTMQSALLEFTTDYVARISEKDPNPDCMYHLLPHHQFLCHTWAMMGEDVGRPSSSSPGTGGGNPWNATGRPADGPTLVHSDLMQHSLCSLLMGCAIWSRGRFNRTITPQLLGAIYASPSVRQKRASRGVDGILQNLIHGGENLEEYRWLEKRVVAQVKDNAKRQALSLRPNLIAKMLRKITPTDVRPIFQGGDIGFDPATLSSTSRRNGDPDRHPVQLFTASETLALLYHRAVAASAATTAAAPSEGACALTPLNVIVFSGDSLTRELYGRLVHHLRYGVKPPTIPVNRDNVGESSTVVDSVQASFGWMPFFEVPVQEDYVYEVHATHDQLRLFPSVAHNNSVVGTLNQYFVDVAKRRHASPCDADDALLYIIFLWDPFTQRPRRDALAPCRSSLHLDQPTPKATMRFLFYRKHRKLNVTPTIPPVPLRSLGARVGLHVHGAVHWERTLFPQLSQHWATMATGCDAVRPFGAATNATHPVHDDTHFYVMTSASGDPLGHNDVPPYLFPVLASPATSLDAPLLSEVLGPNASSTDPSTFRLKDERVARTLHLFEWLKQVQQMRGADVSLSSSRFLSKVRILDKGKIPYAPGNVFARVDGTHLSCHGFSRLHGMSLRDAFYGPFVVTMLLGNRGLGMPRGSLRGDIPPMRFMKSMRNVFQAAHHELQVRSRLDDQGSTPDEERGRREPFALLPLAGGTQGYIRPEYRLTDQCGDFGNFVVLNTLLHDVLRSDDGVAAPPSTA